MYSTPITPVNSISTTGAQGDNGGPPLDDDVSTMRWVRVSVVELLEGIEELSWEARGFYLTALFKMYARMGGLPADDRAGASALRCDVRTFRRLRDALIKSGKLYVDGDRLMNGRVEREIASFCRETKRRRDAALEREEKRRKSLTNTSTETDELQAGAGEVRGEVGPKSGRSRGEVGAKFPRSDFANAENADEKPSKIKVCSATVVERADHSTGGNQETKKPRNQEKKKESSSSVSEVGAATDGCAAGPDGRLSKSNLDHLERQLVDACNGALDNPANCLGLLNLAVPQMWLAQGCDLDLDVLPTLRAAGRKLHGKRIRDWSYFSGMISEAKAKREAGLPPASVTAGESTAARLSRKLRQMTDGGRNG